MGLLVISIHRPFSGRVRTTKAAKVKMVCQWRLYLLTRSLLPLQPCVCWRVSPKLMGTFPANLSAAESGGNHNDTYLTASADLCPLRTRRDHKCSLGWLGSGTSAIELPKMTSRAMCVNGPARYHTASTFSPLLLCIDWRIINELRSVARNAMQRVAMPDGALTCIGMDGMQLHRIDNSKGPRKVIAGVSFWCGDMLAVLVSTRNIATIAPCLSSLTCCVEPGATLYFSHFCNRQPRRHYLLLQHERNGRGARDSYILNKSISIVFEDSLWKRNRFRFMARVRKEFSTKQFGVSLGHHSNTSFSVTRPPWRIILIIWAFLCIEVSDIKVPHEDVVIVSSKPFGRVNVWDCLSKQIPPMILPVLRWSIPETTAHNNHNLLKNSRFVCHLPIVASISGQPLLRNLFWSFLLVLNALKTCQRVDWRVQLQNRNMKGHIQCDIRPTQPCFPIGDVSIIWVSPFEINIKPIIDRCQRGISGEVLSRRPELFDNKLKLAWKSFEMYAIYLLKRSFIWLVQLPGGVTSVPLFVWGREG